MFISDSLSINSRDILCFGNADLSCLAEKYGTPLYVFDENNITQNMLSYKKVIDEKYTGHGMVFYASKAFCIKEMCRIADKNGLGLDVVSGGELHTAISAGVAPEKLCFHGNNKSDSEISDAVKLGIGRIVADGEYEIQRINKFAQDALTKQKILIRINPGVEAHTHEFVMTGKTDSKFGVSLETGEAFELIKKAAALPHIELAGIHCHIGSQIFDIEAFKIAVSKMVTLMAMAKKSGINLYELDIGGGFGIRYTKDDKKISYLEFASAIASEVSLCCAKENIDKPFLMFEPGRSIVGEAGITIYTVGAIKDIPGIRKYVSVDGGMADNPRFIMYGSEYTALPIRNPLASETEKITICGKSCESGDILIKDITMPRLSSGDIIAVLSTGAYNYSMSSNYNRLPRPAVVIIKDGIDRLVVKRETYDDIIRNDL